MSKEKRSDHLWSTGDHAPFRNELVAWPSATVPQEEAAAAPEVSASAPPMVVGVPGVAGVPDVAAELVRAQNEVRRLLARIEVLVGENEQLRRAAGRRLGGL